MPELFPTEAGYAIRFRYDRYEPSPGADLAPMAALRGILAGRMVQACAVHTTEDRPQRYAGDCVDGLVVFLRVDDEQEDSPAPRITAHWSGAELPEVTGPLMTVMADLLAAARFLADLADPWQFIHVLAGTDPGPMDDDRRELTALYAATARHEARLGLLREETFARDGIA